MLKCLVGLTTAILHSIQVHSSILRLLRTSHRIQHCEKVLQQDIESVHSIISTFSVGCWDCKLRIEIKYTDLHRLIVAKTTRRFYFFFRFFSFVLIDFSYHRWWHDAKSWTENFECGESNEFQVTTDDWREMDEGSRWQQIDSGVYPLHIQKNGIESMGRRRTREWKLFFISFPPLFRSFVQSISLDSPPLRTSFCVVLEDFGTTNSQVEPMTDLVCSLHTFVVL